MGLLQGLVGRLSLHLEDPSWAIGRPLSEPSTGPVGVPAELPQDSGMCFLDLQFETSGEGEGSVQRRALRSCMPNLQSVGGG